MLQRQLNLPLTLRIQAPHIVFEQAAIFRIVAAFTSLHVCAFLKAVSKRNVSCPDSKHLLHSSAMAKAKFFMRISRNHCHFHKFPAFWSSIRDVSLVKVRIGTVNPYRIGTNRSTSSARTNAAMAHKIANIFFIAFLVF